MSGSSIPWDAIQKLIPNGCSVQHACIGWGLDEWHLLGYDATGKQVEIGSAMSLRELLLGADAMPVGESRWWAMDWARDSKDLNHDS